jgi:hypothetical protein
MGAARRSAEEGPEHGVRTLGDLLYADKSKARIPEAYWIGLVQSIAKGDQLAFRALYEQTQRLVFTLIATRPPRKRRSTSSTTSGGEPRRTTRPGAP